MVFQIPLLFDLVTAFVHEDTFSSFLSMSLLTSIALVIYVTFFNIPYGRTYTRGRALLKAEVSDRVSFILVHSIAPLVYAYTHYVLPNGALFSLESLLYLSFYAHRCLVYPLFRKRHSKPWPLETVLYFCISGFIQGISVARLQIFNGEPRALPIRIGAAVVFVALAVGSAIHDYKLAALRTAGDKGYHIPKGLLFRWVSSPNVLLELLMWYVYAVFLPWGFGLLTFILWVTGNLSGRAESIHEWYQRAFKNNYPKDRTAYIPFVHNSRWFL